MKSNKCLLATAVLAALLSSSAIAETTQQQLDQFANGVNLQFSLQENNPADCPDTAPWGLCNNYDIRLTNTAGALEGNDWSIFFHDIRLILGHVSEDFNVTHINGDLYKVTPKPGFGGFASGETKVINITSQYWKIVETDFMPRAYVAADGLQPAIIANTDSDTPDSYLVPLTDPEKHLKRTSGDNTVMATPDVLFEANADIAALAESNLAAKILPTPLDVQRGDQTVSINAADWVIMAKWNTQGEAMILQEKLSAVLQGEVSIQEWNIPTDAKVISVEVGSVSGAADAAEGYELNITSGGITVTGKDVAGAFYGVQSLINLLPAATSQSAAIEVPDLKVADAPRFPHRGMQVDIGRNFTGKEFLLKLVNQMGSYKLNKLHLALTNDEGFRLEIPGLPELTDVGAQRCHDLTEQTCILPQLGSGPFNNNDGSGYLTTADYLEILQAAKARHIEVIPEFNMPGHARAAIIAMEARYNRLTAEGKPDEAAQYLLSDPQDKSSYLSIQNYTDNAINACMGSSYTFVRKLVAEVTALHWQAGLPLKTWHMGADEVAEGAWTQSPECEKLFNAEGSTVKRPHDLVEYFVKNVSGIVQDYGMSLAGWQDGLRQFNADDSRSFIDPNELAGDTLANYWEILMWGGQTNHNTLANLGYKLVDSTPEFLYFDFPYEADPKERGYYWGTRYTNTRKLFGYMPENYSANAELMIDRQGNPITANDPVPLTAPENVVGIQAQSWTETIMNAEQHDYMTYPRLLPLAERAWHKPAWEPAYVAGRTYSNVPGSETNYVDRQALKSDWEAFANLLGQRELAKLDLAGVDYRLPNPGAKVEAGKLLANTPFPGLGIQVSTNQGQSWDTYQADMTVGGEVWLRSVDATGTRFSRVSKIN